MNNLFIIFFILLFLNAFHQTILTDKEAQSETTNKCNIPLLKSYVHSGLEEQSRSPFPLSPSQQNHCRQMTSTCCTEEEFSEVYENVENNVNIISNIGIHYKETLETLVDISDEQLDQIYASFKEAPFNVEELQSVVKKLKNDPNDAYHYWNNAYEYALRNGSGIVCGICVPENHKSIEVTVSNNSPPEFEVHVEATECFNTINDVGIKYLTGFLNDAIWLYRLAYLMNSLYNVNHEFEDEYIQQVEEGGEFSFDSTQCKDSDYFNDNLDECTDLCRNLGIVNLNPFVYYTDMLSTVFAIINDFGGDQDYIKKDKKLIEERLEAKPSSLDHVKSTLSESQDQILSFEEYFLKTKETINKTDFLEAFHDVQLNLVHIPIILDNEGWKTYDYGAYVFADDYENKWGKKDERAESPAKSVSLEVKPAQIQKKKIVSFDLTKPKSISSNREGISLLRMVTSLVLFLIIFK